MARNVERVWEPGCPLTVDLYRRNPLHKGGFQAVSKLSDTSFFLLKAVHGEVHGAGHAYNIGNVFCSRAPSSFLMAADHERSAGGAPSHVKCADSLRGVELVARKGQEVHMPEVA